MPSGGARARSGPAPDPNALRRDRKDDAAGWVTLPADGRKGDAPAWPLIVTEDAYASAGRRIGLGRALHERELELWADMWRLPQAIIWERDRLPIVVALFVRQLAEGELPLSSAENRKTIKSYLADLYLTPDSLVRARYKIGTPEPVQSVRSFRKTTTTTHLAVVVAPGDDDDADA